MKKILIEVSEDILNNINEPINDDALLRYIIKKGVVIDGLTNGEVIQMMFPQMNIISASPFSVYIEMKECNQFNNLVSFDVNWWNRKWGE